MRGCNFATNESLIAFNTKQLNFSVGGPPFVALQYGPYKIGYSSEASIVS